MNRSGASSANSKRGINSTLNSTINNNNNTINNSELLMVAAGSNPSPLPVSGTNSQSGSLGASISDLSSDAHSETSDINHHHNQLTSNKSNGNSLRVDSGVTPRKTSIPSLPKSFSSNSNNNGTTNSGTSTPTKGGSSRLPVPQSNKK